MSSGEEYNIGEAKMQAAHGWPGRGAVVDTRRNFLVGMLVTGVAGATLAAGQNPHPPRPQRADQEAAGDAPNLPSPEKRVLDENEKEIKKKVERLYDLALDLKAEVEKTDSSKVLSLNMLRKAEEIERLARDIKNKSKG
jgi:hypothetical protein